MHSFKAPNIITTKPYMTYDGTIYNSKYDFQIDHNKGDLYQVFLKATLSTSLVATTIKGVLGTKLFKRIRLHDGSSTLQTINPFIFQARVDLVNSEVMGDRYDYALRNMNAFSAGDVVIYCPVPFFFSDDKKRPLDLFARKKQLFVECITNGTRESLGLNQDLTKFNVEMICYYRRPEVISLIPKPLKFTYDVFMEPPVVCLSTSTTVRIKLTCPFPTFLVHFLIETADMSKIAITNIKFDDPNFEMFNIDTRINFLLSDNTDSFNLGSTETIVFGSRFDNSQWIKFSQEGSPTWVELSYASAANGTLYTSCEHYTELENVGDSIIPKTVGLFSNFST